MTTYLLYPKGTGSFVEAPPTDVIAKYLATPTTPVFIASNSPSAGMVLIATSATNATWQNPTAFTTINDLRINGNVTNTATAAGTRSVALGRNTYAAGVDSITLGPNTITGTSKSVVVGNDCSTVARTYEADGDQCVIVGSSNVITNAGGPGLGATYDYGIILGANNVLTYGSGGNYERGKNAVIGTGNVITMNHSFGGRRNYFMVSDHTISTDIAHGSSISSNIIIGYGGSYTSDNTAASNNVIIGSTPTWTGCNNSVKIGNSIVGGLKTSVAIGQSLTVHSSGYTDFIGIGRDLTYLGANDTTGLIMMGSGNFVDNFSQTCPNSVLIGRGAKVAGVSAIAIGTGVACGFGAGAIAIGSGTTVATGVGAIAIGTDCNSYSALPSGKTIAIGNSTAARGDQAISFGWATLADGAYSIAIGNNVIIQPSATQSIAIGRSAACTNTATNAVQLGIGTNSTANSLQFKDYRIHDGTTSPDNSIVLKEAITGHYKASGTGWNVTASPNDPTYPGLVAGRTTDPNNTQFTDYTEYFTRDDPAFELDVSATAPYSCTMMYRDGVNFCRGYHRDQTRVHGFDQRWGANQFWRYAEGRSTTNDDMLIPFVAVPPAHYCHMELTITAMRMAGYDEGTQQYTAFTTGGGSSFDIDPGKIGGRSWAGIAACVHYANGATQVCNVDNNWGGNVAKEDNSAIATSVLGIATTGTSALLGSTPIVGSFLGGGFTMAVQATMFGVTEGTKKFKPECGFSRWDTGIGSFGDYEMRGLGYVEDYASTYPGNVKLFGMYIKGKNGHLVNWRIIARCTLVPFAHPGAPTHA